MPIMTEQYKKFVDGAQPVEQYNMTTIGTVVDTNDPQQMGRVRVICSTLGETLDSPLGDIPWAIYASPFGGVVSTKNKGPEKQDISQDGAVAYGFWSIPKVGSQVLVLFIDGDPNLRVYFACLQDMQRPHTMPSGRFMYEDHPSLQKSGTDPRPFGPYTSRENFIQPLRANLEQAFPKGEPNYEWRTRAADQTASALDIQDLSVTDSSAADDKDVVWEDWTSRQGYTVSRVNPEGPDIYGEGNLDNTMHSWTTPGFHSFSMDDNPKNERIRIRTAAGHQVLLDDTNERIYIQTAMGENWIEIDQRGNIDIFTSNKVNIRAKKDINFTSDETIRLHAKKGIHMYTDEEMRFHAKQDVHFKFEQNWRTNVSQSAFVQTGQSLHIKTGQTTFIDAGSEINAKSGSNLNLTSGAQMNLLAGGNIVETGSNIHLNGPGATAASSAETPNEQPAFWTSRVPDHEPWGRVMTQNDFTHAPEVPYEDKQNGRVERGQTITRGTYWRR